MYFTYLRDYASRYTDTFVFRRDGNTLVPIRVLDVKGSDNEPMFTGVEMLPSGNMDVDTHQYKFKDPDIILNVPKFGMVSCEGTLSYVARKPVRRWKQGFTLQNCAIRDYVRTNDRRLNIYSTFNSINVPLDEALERAKNSNRGLRVGMYAGIVGTGTDKATLVYRDKVAGSISGGKLIIPDTLKCLVDPFKRIGFKDIDIVEDVNPADAVSKYREMFYDEPYVGDLRDAGISFMSSWGTKRSLCYMESYKPLAFVKAKPQLNSIMNMVKDIIYRCRVESNTAVRYTIEDGRYVMRRDDTAAELSIGKVLKIVKNLGMNPVVMNDKKLFNDWYGMVEFLKADHYRKVLHIRGIQLDKLSELGWENPNNNQRQRPMFQMGHFEAPNF